MKKYLLFSIIFILAIVLTVFLSFHKKTDQPHIFLCKSDYIEDRVEDKGMTLFTHVSIIIDMNKNIGTVSFNGNLVSLKEIYKIKRTTHFSLVSSGDKYALTGIELYITKEDNAPAEKLKDFNLVTSDINFSTFEAVKNKDSSFTLYNSHEPILVCSQ
ncbi:hypothetical protein ACLMPM_24280 [Yersinia enterocolitica]|uniref:hypothetical protein n=1 Tax=Yersinia enterocolitica TaxID=630 RepID=UPI00398CFC7C